MSEKEIILSVCLTCCNKYEGQNKTRAGQRFVNKLKDRFKEKKI